MRHRKLTLILLLFPLLFAARASAQDSRGFDYKAYEPSTFAELFKKLAVKELDDPKYGEGSVAIGPSYRSRVKVTYTGESRTIPDGRKELIAEWVKTYELDPLFVELFEDEWKFVENGVEYWLPVQKQVASQFGKELKKGDAVTLYALIAGGRKVAGRWDWVVLVNEYDTGPKGKSPGKDSGKS